MSAIGLPAPDRTVPGARDRIGRDRIGAAGRIWDCACRDGPPAKDSTAASKIAVDVSELLKRLRPPA